MLIRLGCVMLLTLLVACSSDDADPAADCGVAGASCETNGATCTSATDRCACELSAWECEALACPAGAEVEGDACATAGMHCGIGFEDPGSRCVGPELTWARCRYYHQGGGPPNGCPPSAPAIGTPCCQGLGNSGPTLGCVYGADVIDCVNDHWVAQ